MVTMLDACKFVQDKKPHSFTHPAFSSQTNFFDCRVEALNLNYRGHELTALNTKQLAKTAVDKGIPLVRARQTFHSSCSQLQIDVRQRNLLWCAHLEEDPLDRPALHAPLLLDHRVEQLPRGDSLRSNDRFTENLTNVTFLKNFCLRRMFSDELK